MTAPEPIRHNHTTRDIKALGLCPACDRYWRQDFTSPERDPEQ